MLRGLGRARMEAHGLARSTRPIPAGQTWNATLGAFPSTQLRLLTQTSCSQAQPCTSGLECHLLPAAPLSSPCEGTAAATNFLLLHQLSPSFNSSQTPDPESNAISQAAGVPRVAGIAADANKVLFSLPFMQFLAGASLSPQRPHPESSCSLILYP